MSKISLKPGTMLSPVPAVLVSSADGDVKNVCTVAWTGIVSSNPPRTYISLRPSRLSSEIIKKTGVFCINLPSQQLVKITDLCGVKSGRELNKFSELSINAVKCEKIDCVSIAQCPVCIECRVFDVIPLGSHDMFLADIVNVSVDEALVDSEGKLHLEKASLFAYSHGEYFALGKRIGNFGFSVKKKRPKPKTEYRK